MLHVTLSAVAMKAYYLREPIFFFSAKNGKLLILEITYVFIWGMVKRTHQTVTMELNKAETQLGGGDYLLTESPQ